MSEEMRKEGFLFVGGVAILAAVAFFLATYLALMYANQPPLDVHAFRQTQTALSAYWFVRDGFKLAYDTPVAGFPWSIPFEFPIFQLLVAAISRLSGISLDIAGRLTSYLFLVLCIPPSRSITKLLRLPDTVFYIFCSLLFSAPVYVYWGRTFMIETAALFFSIFSIKLFMDALVNGFTVRRSFWLFLFLTASVLQKSTTGLPVLGMLSIVFAVAEAKTMAAGLRYPFGKTALVAAFCFMIPLIIAVGWVCFTDQIKSDNPLGFYLTSSALSVWNWGTFAQKLSEDLLVKVLWQRIFAINVGGVLGIGVILVGLLVTSELRIKKIVLFALVLGLAPLFVFTNLHIVHDYYQVANVIYIIYAVAVVLGAIWVPLVGSRATMSVLLLIVVSNYGALIGGYLPKIRQIITKENRDLAIGEILKRELPREGQFVAFGNDWSSTFAYVSERKSFTVPEWFKGYDAVKSSPEKFVEMNRLGAVVSCSDKALNISELLAWSSEERSWKIGDTRGCLVATPEKRFEGSEPPQVQCHGNIDMAEVAVRSGKRILSIEGWSTFGTSANIPEDVYVTLAGGGRKKIYLEALRVPRLDVNASYAIDARYDVGFSRIVAADFPPGVYSIGVVQFSDGRFQSCQFTKQIVLEK